MENEENKDLVSTEGELFVYSAGDEAKDSEGNDVDSSKFEFVQQNKNIHDVKFNTKPTTFLKDAMKRFRKNRSSVVGGVILGVLFLLALILPVSITGYDTTIIHSYETHLPMKLFSAGSGFWDGTVVQKGAAYPYQVDGDGNDVTDDDGNPIFNDYDTYPDPTAIVSYSNKTEEYKNFSSANGSGGFVKVTKTMNENLSFGKLYNYAYSGYDFTKNTYSLTYTLGRYLDESYTLPKYSLLMRVGTTEYYINGGLTNNYGEIDHSYSGVYAESYQPVTVTLNDAINNAYTRDASTGTFNKAENIDLSGKSISFGFIFFNKTDSNVAFLVRDFRITNAKAAMSERNALNMRSFGSTSDGTTAKVADANDVVRVEKDNKGVANQSYWTSISDDRYDAVDCFTVVADLRIDQYKMVYGLRNNMTVSQSSLESWKQKGLVNYTSLDALVSDPSKLEITEEGENSSEVYVTQLSSVVKNGEGNYTITGQVMMYKYLGYSSMPIHLFGTDYQGKDMLKYVFSGLRTSLILGIIVSLINIVIGVIWGSISGYYGGAVDITMERITDILGGIPYIVLMTVLTIKMGQTFFVFALSLCLTGWIGTASTTRSQFYRYRGREYVLAAKTLGAKPPRLIFRHILPNAVGTIVTRSILMIPSTIFSESTIAYLGLGLTNLDSLGVILSKNQAYLSQYPYELIFPAVIISLLMICFNLFGNGLRDAFNPSLKGED